MFDVPVTLAVKSCVPDAGTEALVGLTLSKTATAATMVTLAEADLVGSATLVAVIVTSGDEGTLAGATYSPLAEIVPHAAAVQPAPLNVQVTEVFEVPLTVAANCWLLPAVTVTLFGLTVIANGCRLPLWVLEGGAAMAVPAARIKVIIRAASTGAKESPAR